MTDVEISGESVTVVTAVPEPIMLEVTGSFEEAVNLTGTVPGGKKWKLLITISATEEDI